MATHSSVLAWRIPGTGETGGLPSMGSHRVVNDWNDLAAAVAACAVCLLVGSWSSFLFSIFRISESALWPQMSALWVPSCVSDCMATTWVTDPGSLILQFDTSLLLTLLTVGTAPALVLCFPFCSFELNRQGDWFCHIAHFHFLLLFIISVADTVTGRIDMYSCCFFLNAI